MSDILVILGHPDTNSYCAALADAYVRGARAAGAQVKLVKLAELDFDPVLHHGYNEIQELEPDLQEMQREISAARHVVWVYPMWWVGAPAPVSCSCATACSHVALLGTGVGQLPLSRV